RSTRDWSSDVCSSDLNPKDEIRRKSEGRMTKRSVSARIFGLRVSSSLRISSFVIRVSRPSSVPQVDEQIHDPGNNSPQPDALVTWPQLSAREGHNVICGDRA